MKLRYYFWKFIHNGIVHGLFMSWPREPQWISRLHDWTAGKLKVSTGKKGGGGVTS